MLRICDRTSTILFVLNVFKISIFNFFENSTRNCNLTIFSLRLYQNGDDFDGVRFNRSKTDYNILWLFNTHTHACAQNIVYYVYIIFCMNGMYVCRGKEIFAAVRLLRVEK